jgi:hypothetical protein
MIKNQIFKLRENCPAGAKKSKVLLREQKSVARRHSITSRSSIFLFIAPPISFV